MDIPSYDNEMHGRNLILLTVCCYTNANWTLVRHTIQDIECRFDSGEDNIYFVLVLTRI